MIKNYGALTGAISTILVFIIDIIYSRPEQRDRWPMLDPNGHIPTATDPSNGHLKGLADLLGKEFTPEREKGDARAKSSSKLSMIGDKRDAKNMTEGGPITLTKLRIHAVMRIVIWTAAACIAGSSGTAIWFVKDGGTVRRLEDRVLTGVIVQCVGVAVIVVGPT